MRLSAINSSQFINSHKISANEEMPNSQTHTDCKLECFPTFLVEFTKQSAFKIGFFLWEMKIKWNYRSGRKWEEKFVEIRNWNWKIWTLKKLNVLRRKIWISFKNNRRILCKILKRSEIRLCFEDFFNTAFFLKSFGVIFNPAHFCLILRINFLNQVVSQSLQIYFWCTKSIFQKNKKKYFETIPQLNFPSIST